MLAWILTFAPLIVLVAHTDEMPGSIVLAAAVAALPYLWLGGAMVRRSGARVRVETALFAFVWGAGVAATIARMTHDWLLAGAGGHPWLPIAGAPLIEEAAKAGVLLLVTLAWNDALRSVGAGIALGWLTGVGFTIAENVEYFLTARIARGPEGLVHVFVIRGLLQGALHPVFAACMGAALGLARTARSARRQLRIALLGFAAAVMQHAFWNGVASGVVAAILCNGRNPLGACRNDPDPVQLLVVVPLVVVGSLAPAGIGLLVLVRRAVRQAPWRPHEAELPEATRPTIDRHADV